MFRNHMSTTELLQKIDLLPPEERATIENLVEILAKRHRSQAVPAAERFSQDVLDRIDERREKIFREHGLLDSAAAIREFRDGRF